MADGLREFVVATQSPFTNFDDLFGSLLRLLGENFKYHNRVFVSSVDDSLRLILIRNSQFVSTRTDCGHGPRMRQLQKLSTLEPSQQ